MDILRFENHNRGEAYVQRHVIDFAGTPMQLVFEEWADDGTPAGRCRGAATFPLEDGRTLFTVRLINRTTGEIFSAAPDAAQDVQWRPWSAREEDRKTAE